jgi:DNA-directed RNA polymerase specialized sigma24 family protein
MEFCRRFDPVISRAVKRTCAKWRSADLSQMEELAQQTYLKLLSDDCRALRTFVSQGPGAISKYLQKIAENTVHSHFQARYGPDRGGKQPHSSLDAFLEQVIPDRQSGSDSVHRKISIDEIFEFLENTLSGPHRERDILIFSYHYRLGMSARAIAAIPELKIGESGVESVLHTLRELIRKYFGRDNTGEAA